MTSTEPTLSADEGAEIAPAVIEKRGGEVVALAVLAERARNYARSSKAANTG